MLERKRTVAEPTAKEPEKPDEIFIHPSYYSLTIDRGKDQRAQNLKIGNGEEITDSGDGLYSVHVGRLTRELIVSSRKKGPLKKYSYDGDDLIVRGQPREFPAANSTFVDIIAESLGMNIRLASEKLKIHYNGPEGEKKAIIFIDCREIIDNYTILPFRKHNVARSEICEEFVSVGVARIDADSVYTDDLWENDSAIAERAYHNLIEDANYQGLLEDRVAYAAFSIDMTKADNRQLQLLMFAPESKMLAPVPMLFGACWVNSDEGSAFETCAPEHTWDGYLMDIGKKHIATRKGKVLDWSSFDRAWQNSKFDVSES